MARQFTEIGKTEQLHKAGFSTARFQRQAWLLIFPQYFSGIMQLQMILPEWSKDPPGRRS